MLVCIVVSCVAGLPPINVVAEPTNIGTLAAFVLVSAAVLILRRTQPNLRRAFRVPLVPWIPPLSIIASLVLIVSLPRVTLVRFAAWLAIGMVIYFLYSRHKSPLQHEAAASHPKAFQETPPFEQPCV